TAATRLAKRWCGTCITAAASSSVASCLPMRCEVLFARHCEPTVARMRAADGSAKQSMDPPTKSGLLRRFAFRNDENCVSFFKPRPEPAHGRSCRQRPRCDLSETDAARDRQGASGDRRARREIHRDVAILRARYV